MNLLSEAEDKFVKERLCEECLALYLQHKLDPRDALVAAKLPHNMQSAFAVKCMRDFNVLGFKYDKLPDSKPQDYVDAEDEFEAYDIRPKNSNWEG